MNEKTLIVTDDKGNIVEYEIVLTFKSPETNKSYVVYKEPGDTEEVMAASYNETDGESGELMEIESDEEFDIIQDVLNAFLEEE